MLTKSYLFMSTSKNTRVVFCIQSCSLSLMCKNAYWNIPRILHILPFNNTLEGKPLKLNEQTSCIGVVLIDDWKLNPKIWSEENKSQQSHRQSHDKHCRSIEQTSFLPMQHSLRVASSRRGEPPLVSRQHVSRRVAYALFCAHARQKDTLFTNWPFVALRGVDSSWMVYIASMWEPPSPRMA